MMKYLFLSALLPLILPDLTGTYSRKKKYRDNDNDYQVIWTLKLEKDSSYTLNTEHIGGSVFTIVQSPGNGKWTVNGDTLKLITAPTGKLRRFLVREKILVALDEPRYPTSIIPAPPLDTLELQ
ncbi:copper resistance protein NlpE N-terminal domain-containing protein [Chitinophaga sp.]|uniref:copper resistance protein NlpE N-terminal domain-containing protein n=1 Tax=Chitinophaga sp. TaxID=1869181 RepID=UPI0031D5AAF2